MQADLSDGAAKATVRGVAGSPGDFEQLDLEVAFSSDQPAALARRLLGPEAGQWAELLGAVRLKGRLRGNKSEGLTLDDGVLDMGRTEQLAVKVSGSLHDVLGGSGVEMKLEIHSPDLARALGPLGWELSGLGAARLSAKLRGDAAAPRVEDIRLLLEPHEGLKAEVFGGLHYKDGIQGEFDLSIDADDPRSLADFVLALAPSATSDLRAVLEESRQRPLLHHLLALKPLAMSGHLAGTGTSWSLDQFDATAGDIGRDWIALTGGARSLWPRPNGLELRLKGRLEAPGQLPGLGDKPVAQLETIEVAATLVQSAGGPTELRQIDVRATAHDGVELELRGSVLLSAADDDHSGKLSIDLRAPSLASIGKTWGGSLPDWGPVAAKGHLVGSPTRLRLEEFTTQLGKTRITAQGSLSRTSDIPRMELSLRT
jgi:hypothetical protein